MPDVVVRPELLDLKAEDVRPFDHVAEGRVVIVMEFGPDWVQIVTCITEVVENDEGRLEPWHRDHQTERVSRDKVIRVIRGVPLDAPGWGTATLKYKGGELRGLVGPVHIGIVEMR